ncbi:MAG: primosomal protein N' [Ruminococcus sp.]|nr:primosomal protein N' [Ruminococcus sp.]
MQVKFTVAKVALSNAALSFDVEYSYRVPQSLESSVKSGSRVLVPFGKGNRKRIGFITRLKDYEHCREELKSIISVVDEQPLVNEEMLRLIFWLKENTFCTYYEAYKTLVPIGYDYNLTTHYKAVNAHLDAELTEEEQSLLNAFLLAESQREKDLLMSANGNSKKKAVVESLIEKGAIEEADILKRKVGDETVRMVRLTNAFLDAEVGGKITPKQQQIIDLLADCETASVKEICYMLGVTQSVIKRLIQNGICEIYDAEILRTPDVKQVKREDPEDIVLSREQQSVFSGIFELVKQQKPCGSLLYGVTGSGKTNVFIKLINEVLKMGKTALMLIPEISLTPQTVMKFRSLFGETVAVIHSSLSLGQRVDEFKRIKSGQAKIVIGTRSAVFAPLDNIGIIIIDEEGEHTYKSENSPRYHARDVAIQRCGYHNATLLLASATPSIESYYYAKSGRFHLFELPHRYNKAALPDVVTVDMQQEVESGNNSIFSRALKQAIDENLQKHEQTILLLNRRGFNTYITCLECRTPVECPNCNIPLTYHKKNNRLMCHYCGYTRSKVTECDHCHSTHLKATGVGTQRVEDEVERLFPTARVLRMDADTTASRYAYEKYFEAFGKGEYDIMLGTQMIAKGLDFENVTLVGVLSLDRSLYTGGFQSYEKTFSLLTQVVGRSGRGSKKGVAFIQTFSPEHYVINLASQQDYKGFYEGEIELRRALTYPPFCDICVVGFSSEVNDEAQRCAQEFIRIFRKYIAELSYNMPLRMLGPSPCVMTRLNGRFRHRIIIKCKNNSAFRELMGKTLVEASKSKMFSNTRVFADMNGDTGI